MTRHLRDQIRQSKPFESLSTEVYLEILKTSQTAGRWVVEALKPSSLTPAQFNVLRILRGSPDGLTCSQISERMINPDPDVTRLLDRLAAAGLVEKQRNDRDRRVVDVVITKTGLKATEQASNAVRSRLESEMKTLSATQLNTLADLLELVRGDED